MHFFAPQFLLALWLIPILAILYSISRKVWRKRLQKLVQSPELQDKLLTGYKKNEWKLSGILVLLAFLFFIFAAARPQWGEEKRMAQRKGVDIIFLLDTSLSMLAEDTKPNRLEKSKFEIKTFIEGLRGDRIGMVTFAGSGFLQTPLTHDHSAFLLFLDAVSPGFLPDPGTSLSQAISLATRAFPQQELKYKALIIFSDGEDHGGEIDEAIADAKRANVRIYTIGLGKKEGEPIPLKNAKGERTGFKKSRAGELVLTKLNQPLLERLANETGGIYLPATPSEKETALVLKHLRNWGEQQFEEKTIVEREDQYQTLLFIGFLFLLLEMLIKRQNAKSSTILPVLISFFLFSGFIETSKRVVEKGNENFKNKKYQSAVENYRKAQVKNPDSPEILYNIGSALYKTDSFQEAAKDFSVASSQKKIAPSLQAKAFYNLGNTQYRLGEFDKAIQSYKKTLELDPNDQDAKYNLEFLQKKKGEMDKKDQERQNDKQNQQNKDKNKDRQQDQQNQQQDKNQQNEQNQPGQGQGGQAKEQQDKNDGEQDKGESSQQQKDQKNQDKENPQNNSENQDDKKSDKNDKDNQQSKPEQEKQNEQKQQAQAKQPLQGQMKLQDALNLLDALKESEKETQALRRPPPSEQVFDIDKDW